jgi:hypothetical protein
VLLDNLLLGPLLLLIIICPDPDEVVGTTSDETFLRRDLAWVWGTRTGVVGGRDY